MTMHRYLLDSDECDQRGGVVAQQLRIDVLLLDLVEAVEEVAVSSCQCMLWALRIARILKPRDADSGQQTRWTVDHED